MLIAVFLSVYFNWILLPGSSGSQQVFQTPTSVFSRSGGTANINCSHNVQNYNQILWYKQQASGLLLLGYVYYKDAYTEKGLDVKMTGSADKDQQCMLTVERLDSNGSGVYFCAASRTGGYYEAYFGQGTKLTVLDETPVTPPTVKILQPSEKECKDKTGKKKKTLVCVASGFYPDHVGVSWTRNDLKITDGVSTDAAAKRGKDNYYKITSRLTIPINDWLKPNIEFKCIVSFYNGTANIERDDVFKTKGVDNPGMTRANYLKITQNAKLSYSALIVKSLLYAALVGLLVWKLQGKRGKQTK